MGTSQQQAPMGHQPSLRDRLPSLFQVWMAAMALFELPTIAVLVGGGGNVVDETEWFDRRSHYTKNPAVPFLYAMVLTVLVVVRALTCYRPELVVLVLYAAVVHWLELAFFSSLYAARQDRGYDPVKRRNVSTLIYLVLGAMAFNAVMLSFRFVRLRSALQSEQGQAEEIRRQQLAEIRRKRAEYKKAKEKEAS